MPTPADPARLRDARLLLLFSPELCGARDPLAVLEAALPWIDLVQVRPKPRERQPSAHAPCEARGAYEWTARVLDLVSARPEGPAVTVDDRVDVALALAPRGCAGVHLGQDDCPPAIARGLLGPRAWIGLSTHDLEQVALAGEEPVDYLGFGPVHATTTKGYARGLGAEMAWVASVGSPRPVFAIGGIDATNVGELDRVGRVAVGSAILAAVDPGAAARELRELLSVAGP